MKSLSLGSRSRGRLLCVGAAAAAIIGVGSQALAGAANAGASGLKLIASTPAPTGQVSNVTWDLTAGEPTTLDPVKSGGYSETELSDELCDSLLRITPTYQEVPNIATSYKLATPTTLVLHIRHGVKFWNGDPLTAADVVYSLERNEDASIGAINTSVFKPVKAIDQTGPYTVTIHFKQPDEEFIQELGDDTGDVVDEKYVEKVGTKAYGSQKAGVMCSGPYELKSWTPGKDIVLTRNPSYWNKALEPKIKTVTFDFVTDTNDLTSALVSGQIEGAWDAPFDDIPALEKAKTGALHFGESLQTFALWPVQSTGPADDLAVREVLSDVLDRSAIAEKVFDGAAQPLLSAEPPTTWIPASARSTYAAGYAKLRGSKPDLRAAEKLMKSVPAADKTITLGITGGGDQVEINLGSVVQSEASQVGLTVKIVQLPNFVSSLYNPADRKGIDFMLSENYEPIADQIADLQYFVYPGALENYTKYDNKTVQDLVSKARETYNGVARAKLLVKAQAIYMKYLMVIPIVSLPEVSFTSNKLTGETTSQAFMSEPAMAYVGAK